MSREFGEYGGCGYFHSKIESALSDAKGGRTRGAKIMASILEPLSNMAYAVASEEAHDSSESSVVEAFYDSIDTLRRAVDAISAFTEPAERLLVRELASQINKVAAFDVSGDGYVVSIPAGSFSNVNHTTKTKALQEYVRRKIGKWASWASSTHRSGSDLEQHFLCGWGDDEECARWLREDNTKLRQALALLEIAK